MGYYLTGHNLLAWDILTSQKFNSTKSLKKGAKSLSCLPVEAMLCLCCYLSFHSICVTLYSFFSFLSERLVSFVLLLIDRMCLLEDETHTRNGTRQKEYA